MLRPIARAAGWTLGVFLALLLLWLLANRTLDERLSPQARALLEGGVRVAEKRNVAVGILGLTAPSGADFMAHGAKIMAAAAAHQDTQDLKGGADSLQPTTTDSPVGNCWLDPDWMFSKDCPPLTQAPRVLAENRELLNRYKALYQLDGYFAPDTAFNKAYIELTKLVAAEIQLDLRAGRHEQAFEKWRRQLIFAKHALRGEDNWVGKAIGLVTMGISLSLADPLLYRAPFLAKKHRHELVGILRSEGVEDFNPEAVVRSEFRLLARALDEKPRETPWGIDRLHLLAFYFGQRNRALNRYAEFAPEYLALLRLPWQEARTERSRLRDKYVDATLGNLILDPFGTVFLASFIESQLKARELPKQMRAVDGRMRLTTLAVGILADGIPDARIARFLEASDPLLRDPFLGTPARWDAKDRKIYFVDPQDKCAPLAWIRIPERDGRRKQTSSMVTFKAC